MNAKTITVYSPGKETEAKARRAWQPQPGASLLLARGLACVASLVEWAAWWKTGIGVCWEGRWGAGHSLVGPELGSVCHC